METPDNVIQFPKPPTPQQVKDKQFEDAVKQAEEFGLANEPIIRQMLDSHKWQARTLATARLVQVMLEYPDIMTLVKSKPELREKLVSFAKEQLRQLAEEKSKKGDKNEV